MPEDAEFCGFCGLRAEPLSPAAHEKLTGELEALNKDEPAAPPPPPPADGPPGRRQTPRFPLKVEVDYTSEHNFYTGFLENLSSGGLFIATHQQIEIGQQLEVTFTVPGLAQATTALCEVRWLREENPNTPDIAPGVGCRFVELAADAQAAIELFIRHRDPLFFDED